MKHRVTFKGPGREVEAEHGENLLALARRAGLHIDSSCGGNGSCRQCRVLVHAGREKLQHNGLPTAPRHPPHFLACQSEVCGDITVEAAPTHAIGLPHDRASLAGWHVDAGRKFTVVDAGAFTGALYTLSAEGALDAGRAFRSDAALEGDVLVGRDLSIEQALRRGISHLAGVACVLDFGGRVLKDSVLAAATGAFIGDMPHLPGAIDYVAWSPLKTRTVISTVGGLAPVGMSCSGVLACVHALMQSGMCGRELRLLESRFTREVAGVREAVIVAPNVEAQTVHGEVHTSERPIVISQKQLDVMRAAADVLADMLADCRGTLVVTGDHGTYVPPELITALGIYAGPVVFVPHAAALGAARSSRDI